MSSIARRFVVGTCTTLLMSATAVALNSIQGARDVPTEFNEFTVAQLQDAMNSHRLSSERLTRYYLDRIFALDQNGPGVNAVIELNPGRHRPGPACRFGATARCDDRAVPAPRHPCVVEGQHRYRRPDADDRRVARAQGRAGCAGLHDGGQAAGGRRRHSGQDEFVRVGQLPLDAFDQRLVGSRRSHAQSIFDRSQRVRIQFRIGRGDFGELHGDLVWQRNRRQHRLPGERQRRRRDSSRRLAS